MAVNVGSGWCVIRSVQTEKTLSESLSNVNSASLFRESASLWWEAAVAVFPVPRVQNIIKPTVARKIARFRSCWFISCSFINQDKTLFPVSTKSYTKITVKVLESIHMPNSRNRIAWHQTPHLVNCPRLFKLHKPRTHLRSNQFVFDQTLEVQVADSLLRNCTTLSRKLV